MKPVGTVQLPVGKFLVIVSDITDNDKLAEWVRQFARTLALSDQGGEPFAVELLNDVEAYRQEEARRKAEAKARREQQRAAASPDNELQPTALPKNLQEVLDFAHEQGFADDEWVRWWANENLRKGKGILPDGTRILNWQKQLITAFRTKEKAND